MSIKLKCRCGERLSAPESIIGKRGKCPKCGMTFVVPKPKPVAAGKPLESVAAGSGVGRPDLDEGSPDLSDFFNDAPSEPIPKPDRTNLQHSPQRVATRPRKRAATSRDQMERLANGIKLVFWGTLTVLSTIILGFVGGIASSIAGSAVVSILAVFAYVLPPVGGLLSTIGRIMCLSVPDKVGGKGLIWSAVVCDLAGMALEIADAFGNLPPLLNLASTILWLATLVLFLLFLKGVAIYAGEEDLAEDARAIIILVALSIVTLFSVPIAGMVFLPLALVAMLLCVGVMLYATIKYVNLLQYVAEAVRP